MTSSAKVTIVGRIERPGNAQIRNLHRESVTNQAVAGSKVSVNYTDAFHVSHCRRNLRRHVQQTAVTTVPHQYGLIKNYGFNTLNRAFLEKYIHSYRIEIRQKIKSTRSICQTTFTKTCKNSKFRRPFYNVTTATSVSFLTIT